MAPWATLDRVKAIGKTLAQRPFDEIMLSTLPPGVSPAGSHGTSHMVSDAEPMFRCRSSLPQAAQANDPVGWTQKGRLKQVHISSNTYLSGTLAGCRPQ